jgi:hypothetical protein
MSSGVPGGKVGASYQASGFPAIFPGDSQKVAFTDTSAQSAALSGGSNTDSTIVRVFATEDCHIKIGANPTAIADGTCMFLPAGIVEYIGISPTDKIAAIRDATSGYLYITEGA